MSCGTISPKAEDGNTLADRMVRVQIVDVDDYSNINIIGSNTKSQTLVTSTKARENNRASSNPYGHAPAPKLVDQSGYSVLNQRK